VEEILFFLLQIVIEIAIEGIAYLLTSKSIAKRQSPNGTGVGATAVYAITGGMLGGVSALVYSHVLLPQMWWTRDVSTQIWNLDEYAAILERLFLRSLFRCHQTDVRGELDAISLPTGTAFSTR
jgi:hypothetical protein